MSEAIVIQGACEPAEIIGDGIQEFTCKCGEKIQVACGITLNEKGINILAQGREFTTCPKCGAYVSLK